MNLHEELAAKDSHIALQAARIAELEAQLEEAETLISQTTHGAAERISAMEAQIAAAQSVDTDKLREAIEALDELADEAEANGNTSAWTNSMVAKVRSAMAAQAPVREVPEGWQLVPIEPTKAMWDAECKVDNDAYAGGNLHGASSEQIWHAMLGAAPLPASNKEQV